MKYNTESRTVRLLWVAMAILTIPFLLLCSCSSISSSYSHKYNYGYPGDPRPADEAILTGHQMYYPKLNTIVNPEISKVDDHSCFITTPGSNGRPIGTNAFEVRLLPGIHKIWVEPLGFSPSRYITFEAVAGRHYDLQMEILDHKVASTFVGLRVTIQWNAKIVEVETGKEFNPDVP
jgi:hypothetical protein